MRCFYNKTSFASQLGQCSLKNGYTFAIRAKTLETYKTATNNYFGSSSDKKATDNDRFMRLDQRTEDSAMTLKEVEELTTGQSNNHWKNIEFMKFPFEIALYPEMIYDIKPKCIIETGTFRGGSALWLADTANCLLNQDKNNKHFNYFDKVYTIDISGENVSPLAKQHNKIEFIEGSCQDINKLMKPYLNKIMLSKPWIMIEDCHYYFQDTLSWFKKYSSKGDYLIVEDTHIGYINYWIKMFNDGNKSISIYELELCHKKREILKNLLFNCDNGEQFKIDSYYNDRFGYNRLKSMNSVIKRMY